MSEQKLPILWYEGMPLNPSIFQQDFLYTESKFAFLFKNLNQFCYGIINLEWNDLYITNGILQIKKLECILPDLSFCQLPIDPEDDLSINLKEHSDLLKKEEMFVFLSLPENHLSHDETSTKARYKIKDIGGIKDLSNKETEAQISFLKPDFKLSIGLIPPIGNVSLPLCKIKFTGINFSFSEYAPPVLKLSQSKELLKTMQSLAKTGRDKLAYLSSKNDESINNKIAINNLAKIVFSLEKNIILNQSTDLVYSSLVDILNNAIIFNNTIPMIPEYNHLDHRASITLLIDFISKALEKIEEAYSRKTFQEQEGLFAIMLEENQIDYITIGIEKSFDTELDSIIKWINNAIIASEDKITLMQDQRLIGAKREQIRNDEELDLQANQDMLLIRIKIDKAYITPNKMLCIMNFSKNTKPENLFLFSKK